MKNFKRPRKTWQQSTKILFLPQNLDTTKTACTADKTRPHRRKPNWHVKTECEDFFHAKTLGNHLKTNKSKKTTTKPLQNPKKSSRNHYKSTRKPLHFSIPGDVFSLGCLVHTLLSGRPPRRRGVFGRRCACILWFGVYGHGSKRKALEKPQVFAYFSFFSKGTFVPYHDLSISRWYLFYSLSGLIRSCM